MTGTHTMLGDENAKICVYIGNQPNFNFANPAASAHLICRGEIDAIGKACGNGWRKVFNVYAKWLFACPPTLYPHAEKYASWQTFRDKLLLQKNSGTALLFEPPNFEPNEDSGANALRLIMGRTYAKSLTLPRTLIWVNKEFAFDESNNLVVCPYFDYRQLTNQKIADLIELINQHLRSPYSQETSS